MAEPKPMFNQCVDMARRTWSIIAEDIFNVSLDKKKKTMSREEVIEVVSDADYMMMHGGNEAAYKWFKEQTKEEQMKIMRFAFGYARYGR